MNNTNKWLVERAKERSTWIGITAFLTSIGISISGDLSNVIVSLGVGLGGLIAAITADK